MLGGKATVNQQLKITLRKSSAAPWNKKVHPTPFYSPTIKNSKSGSTPLFANIEKFLDCLCRKGGGEHWWLTWSILEPRSSFDSQSTLDELNASAPCLITCRTQLFFAWYQAEKSKTAKWLSSSGSFRLDKRKTTEKVNIR